MKFITLHEACNNKAAFVNADAILSIAPHEWFDNATSKNRIGSSVMLPSCWHEVHESPDEVLQLIRDINVVDCLTSLKGYSE